MICGDTPTQGLVCGWMDGSVGRWVGPGQITKNFKNVDLSKMIQFCLKIYDCGDTPTHGLVCGWSHESMGRVRSNQ